MFDMDHGSYSEEQKMNLYLSTMQVYENAPFETQSPYKSIDSKLIPHSNQYVVTALNHSLGQRTKL
ncbi:hypothetical protein VCR3J2_410085 [Vibrio coralliirubri]|nr:hypothetical protein VCR3J2_410085 [Vibrio coralliirubri]